MGHRVLVVEDDPTLRGAVRLLLEEEGYDVRSCANGAEALVLLRAGRPCLLLLDMRMPAIDGWGVLRQRRLDADLREVPVVVMSSCEEELLRTSDLRAHPLLRKPFESAALVEAVGARLHNVVCPCQAPSGEEQKGAKASERSPRWPVR